MLFCLGFWVFLFPKCIWEKDENYTFQFEVSQQDLLVPSTGYLVLLNFTK